MKQASALGTENGPSALPNLERRRRKHRRRPRRNSNKRSRTELEVLMQEAPLPVMPVGQREPGQNFGSFDRDHRKLDQPPEHLIHAIQESKQILQTSPVILSQEAGAA